MTRGSDRVRAKKGVREAMLTERLCGPCYLGYSAIRAVGIDRERSKGGPKHDHGHTICVFEDSLFQSGNGSVNIDPHTSHGRSLLSRSSDLVSLYREGIEAVEDRDVGVGGRVWDLGSFAVDGGAENSEIWATVVARVDGAAFAEKVEARRYAVLFSMCRRSLSISFVAGQTHVRYCS